MIGDVAHRAGRRRRTALLLSALAALGATPAGAQSGGRPEPHASILWSHPVRPPATPPSEIVVEGTETNGRFDPQRVVLPAPPAAPKPAALPLGSDILPELRARPFGSEERAEAARVPEGLAIRCRAGREPAGVALELQGFHLPREAGVRLVAKADGGRLGISVVERGSDAPAEPDESLSAGDTRIALPRLAWSPEPKQYDIVVTCPAAESAATLEALVLEPVQGPPQRVTAGTWIWQVGPWLGRGEELARLAEAADLDRIALQIRISDGAVAEPAGLAALIRRLNAEGVAVEAVEGDPAMVTAEGLSNARARIAAIRHYQATAPADARLAGIQFDIEPYLLPARDGAEAWEGWGETMLALAEAWQGPVSAVVPFWMLETEAGRKALAAARPALARLVVMAYRTDATAITALAEPLLAWGAAHGVPVAIALENGVLPDEVHRVYGRAETGTLVLERNGPGATVKLLDRPIPVSGEKAVYEFKREIDVAADRISFMGRLGQLQDARAVLTRLLKAWPSFDGLMFHEYLQKPDGEGEPQARQ